VSGRFLCFSFSHNTLGWYDIVDTRIPIVQPGHCHIRLAEAGHRDLKTDGRDIGQAAFSPDNSKLYGMAYDNNHLFILQYDLNAAVANSLIDPSPYGLLTVT